MTDTATDLRSISLEALLAHEFPHRADLISPILRQGESMLLWAAVGVGKTLLALTMALMVAGGGSALGWHGTAPRKVLLIDGEMSVEDLQERLAWLLGTVEGIDREAAGRNLTVVARTFQGRDVTFPDLGEKAGQDVALRLAEAHGAELLILDNFATLVDCIDENAASAMTPTLALLLRLKQARIATLLIHHSSKGGTSYRGSSKLATTFECIAGLHASESGPSDGAAFRLEFTKYRREPCDAVRSREVRLAKNAAGRRQWIVEADAESEVRAVVEAVRSCKCATGREVATAVGMDDSKISRLKVKAIRDGRITGAEWDLCLREARETGAEF